MSKQLPLRALVYVGATVAVAAALAVSAATLVPGHGGLQTPEVVGIVGLIALAECLQLRFMHNDHVQTVNLIEGTFAPLIFRASGLETVIAVAAGLVVASMVSRNGLVKSIFNIAQWVAAASVGAMVFHASGAGLGVATNADVLALATAILAVWLTNQVLFSGVLWCTSGHPLGTTEPQVLWLLVASRLGSFLASAVLGLLMVASYQWEPWTVVLAAGPLVFLWSAGRAEASIRADRRLLDALQGATHSLASSLDLSVALRQSLAEARAGFEVPEIQLVLVNERGFPTVHRCTISDGYSVEIAPHGLAEMLIDTLLEPTRIGTGTADHVLALARLGHSRAIAAPLRAGVHAIGVLLFLDRDGAEGFEVGELAIAGAFAREIVGFLERVELVKAIDEERRKLADIVENTGDGIISLDADGTILSWNAGMATITGYSAEEMVDTRHFGLLRPRDAHGTDMHIVTWAERPGTSAMSPELQVIASDGSTVWLSCSYSRVPAREGGDESLIIVARNITKARELELLKDDFIAVVSHELRTPLVPIKGWAQTLLNRGDRLSEDQRRTAVRSILNQAQRLEALVLNILESSRVEAGQAEALDAVDVAAVAVHVVEDVLAARPDRLIRVQPPQGPSQVRGSTVWVERAISNLVANAVKYSPDDEAVDVLISVTSGLVSVSVTDRGPGINPESQERIFERFERLEESHKQTGTGLGLYITRRLARGMGGDVSVSSLPGAGSTFVLTLPELSNVAGVIPPSQRRTDNVVNVVNLG
jgi:PAS domain S-box-containing protein